MPTKIVAKLNSAINQIEANGTYQVKYKALSGATVPQNTSVAQAAALLKLDDERYMPLVRKGKIPPE